MTPLMNKKSPPGNRDKEGQDTVAPFRVWRGFLAFNPRPLTEAAHCHAPSVTVNENFGNFFGKALAKIKQARLEERAN